VSCHAWAYHGDVRCPIQNYRGAVNRVKFTVSYYVLLRRARDRMHTRLSYAVIAGILCALAPLVCADQLQVLSVTQPRPGRVIAKVSLPAGEAPTREAFRLHVDDQHAFAADDVTEAAGSPLQTEVALLVDRSGSMGKQAVRKIKSAVKDVVSVPRAPVALALIAFGTKTATLNGMSADLAQAAQAADALTIERSADGKTKLFEAVQGALTTVQASSGTGPKRVVVISDGKDEGSQVGFDAIVRASKDLGITVNGIGFGRLSQTTSGSLRSLAEATGGEFVLARDYTDMFDALDGLLNPVPATPTFDVTFAYEPASNDIWVKTAFLEYKPVGEEGVQQAIAAAVAEPKEAKDGATDGNGSWFKMILNLDIKLEDLLALLAAILALIGGRVTYKIFVARKPPPAPPPAVVQAPPIVPTVPPRRAATSMSPVFPEPQQGKPAGILLATSGPVRGNRYPIDRAKLRIGGSATNDLCTTGDDYVSSQHALIKYEWGSLYLSDLDSRNGTWLNGIRLARTAMALTPGDQIRIGKTVFELQSAQSAHGEDRSGRIEPPVS
jgi:pSer/pThr/pTyr-binding forkhead associated (FHA) protein